MNMHILDIHGQILQRTFRLQRSEPDEITCKGGCSDAAAIQQLMLPHQPVYLFMINDPTLFLQFSGHVVIAITTEFLGKSLFNVLYHYGIFKELSILVYTVGAGFYPF